MKNPFFLRFSLPSSLSFFPLLLNHNRSFHALSFHTPCVSLSPYRAPPLLLFSLSLSLFCSIIAWLINYKGISKSEKRRWHFNLQRKKKPAPTHHTHTHTHLHTTHTAKATINRFFFPLHILLEDFFVIQHALAHARFLLCSHSPAPYTSAKMHTQRA